MAMKAAAVWWLVTGEKGDRASLYQMFDALDRYHGQPWGYFPRTSTTPGAIPRRERNLCAVVEAMFSLETDMAILGDAAFGDRLEKIAYNALPATLTRGPVGATSTISRPTRSWSPSPTAAGPRTVRSPTSSDWSRISAAARRTCIKVGRSWRRTCGWRRRIGGLAAVAYGPSEVSTPVAAARR